LAIKQMLLEKVMPNRWSRLASKDWRLYLSALRSIKYRKLFIILAITVIAYEAAGIFYKAAGLALLGTKTEMPAAEGGGPAAESFRKELFDNYKIITERNLLGSTDKIFADKQSVGGKSPAAPDVMLLFDLRGTVAGEGRYGFAVIEEKSKKKQGLYKVGDTVGGAKLTKIMRNSVALKMGDEEKILRIAETQEAPILPPAGAPGSAAIPAPGSGPIVINKSDVSTSIRDMASLMTQAQIRPYFSMGMPDGFLVTNIRQGSIYQRLGIMDGDIIQGVDERKMQSADDMLEFYNTIKSAPGMNLKVKRQGRQETLTYVFK
jgi:general secretion pathway protein C